MEKNNLIRFVQSLVILPVMTMSLTGVQNIENPQSMLVKKVNIVANGALAFNPALDPKVNEKTKILKEEAEAIDAYFADHDMPLLGTGAKMAEEADKNDLDWRLLPAIAVRESTGGKHSCKRVENNPFGWGSCKIGFDSIDEAIETLAKNLGGNNPNTAKHYDDKTTREILRAYNPPSIVPKYVDQVIKIMKEIGPEEIILDTNS